MWLGSRQHPVTVHNTVHNKAFAYDSPTVTAGEWGGWGSAYNLSTSSPGTPPPEGWGLKSTNAQSFLLRGGAIVLVYFHALLMTF